MADAWMAATSVAMQFLFWPLVFGVGAALIRGVRAAIWRVKRRALAV